MYMYFINMTPTVGALLAHLVERLAAANQGSILTCCPLLHVPHTLPSLTLPCCRYQNKRLKKPIK